jgi:hypothetical protein
MALMLAVCPDCGVIVSITPTAQPIAPGWPSTWWKIAQHDRSPRADDELPPYRVVNGRMEIEMSVRCEGSGKLV